MTTFTGDHLDTGTPRPAAHPVGDRLAGDPVAAATALHDELSRRAGEAEQLGHLPDDLVGTLRAAGLFSLTLPAHLGGQEAAPRTIIETIEILAHADASVGWTVLIGQGSGFLAWLEPAAAAEIISATPEPIVASSFAPLPPAPPGPAGYRLTGAWPYCSGSRHADWVMGAFLVPTSDGPPRMRFGFVPAGQYAIRSTWDPTGLVATASNHLTVDGVLVPSRRTTDPRTDSAQAPGQLYRLSLFSLLLVCMAGFPLGVARRALDEFEELAARKSRSSSRTPLAADPLVQAQVARGEAAYHAARAGVLAAADELWCAAGSGSGVEVAVRARFAGAVQHAMRTATEVVDTSFRLAGGGALYRTAALQRCWRDVQVAASHVVFGPESVRRLGASVLGQDVPAALL